MEATQTPNPTSQSQPANPNPQPEPSPAQQAITEMLKRARKGDETVLPELRQYLLCRSVWQRRYDLITMTEQAWLIQIAPQDLVLRQTLRNQLAKMKLELTGSTPTAIEKLLADRIVTCWLAVQSVEMMTAFGQDAGPRVAAARARQLDAANRRYLAAIKALAVARRLQRGLKIEILHRGDAEQAPATPAAGNQTAAAPGADAVANRLKEMFTEADRVEKEVMAGV